MLAQNLNLTEHVLLYFIYERTGNRIKAQKYLKNIQKFSSIVHDKIIQQDQVHTYPEYANWKIKDLFPSIKLNLFKDLWVSPAFVFPVMQPPLDFNDSCDVIRKIFLKTRLKPRPEVPWLEKIGNTYKFTDCIVDDIS